jgi:glycosyltransferase involved in cell wall biosynthesis
MRVLFLSRWFPFPVSNGSQLRIHSLLRGLNKHHNVTLLSFADQAGINLDSPQVHEVCSDIKVVPWRAYQPERLRSRLSMFALPPRSIVDTFSSEMASTTAGILAANRFDLVIASQLQMAGYRPWFQGVPAIFEEVEVGLFYQRAFARNGRFHLRNALTWFKLRLYLSRLLDSYQACTVVSAQERQLLQRNFSGYSKPVTVIPNGLVLDDYRNITAEKKRNTIIFAGSFKYEVNYEAMRWFISKTFPLILEQVPDAQLLITGDHAKLPLPSSKNVVLTGYVHDIKSLISSCTVSIAPLLSGGGTRLKILEAMALGVPVVATTKGAEGLEVRHDEHLLVADTPVEFAKHVLRLLAEKDVIQRLTRNARVLMEQRYHWDAVMLHYLTLIDSIVR